jgi:ketosteroid isomerase-like protein
MIISSDNHLYRLFERSQARRERSTLMFWFGFQSGLAASVVFALFTILPATAAPDTSESFLFSSDSAISAQQHAAYDVVHRYEQLLNAGDTAGILNLFAPDGIAEWNDKPSFATRQEKMDAYDALFKVAKFSTVFGYAGIDVDGDTAIVRTFHHKGATILENGKEVVDLNREVFVLRRLGGEWKIILYIFNTNPVQGEG